MTRLFVIWHLGACLFRPKSLRFHSDLWMG